MNRELEFYNEVKNWDFSKIKYIEECLTTWNMYDILNKRFIYFRFRYRWRRKTIRVFSQSKGNYWNGLFK